jgi:thiol-disulfide isomerase/thioredoxin
MTTAPVSEPAPEPVATAETPLDEADPAPLPTEPAAEPTSPAVAKPAANELAVPDLLPEEAPAPEAALTRPKWGDLAQASFTPEASQVAPVAALEEKPKAAKKKRWFFQTKAADPAPAPEMATSPLRASCEYVPKDRRLVDFRLADLDGRPVSFHDLGADLVLLDFWGTWCGPCLNSIPKLIELQNLYPESKFKVVGIAYEQDDSLADRVKSVRKTAAELGIPYTVLLGEADGKPCPLKEALHVQVYPTMILVDRQGNLVWRDQGVGPNTFARLERILASRAGQEIARR